MHPDEVTIVLAGAWNQAIFTPDWVTRRLFPEVDRLDVELLFGGVSGIRFTTPEVVINVLPGRVQVAPAVIRGPSIEAAERVAIELLGALSETPMQARGINVVVRSTGGGDVSALFPLPPRLPTSAEAAVAARRVGWCFQLGDDQVNVLGELTDGGVSIEFNFHRAGTSAAALRDGIEGHVQRAVDRALEVSRWMGIEAPEVAQ